jgi:hypothetical protein
MLVIKLGINLVSLLCYLLLLKYYLLLLKFHDLIFAKIKCWIDYIVVLMKK